MSRLNWRPAKERRPVLNIPETVTRVVCKLGTFEMSVNADANDTAKATRIVRKWSDQKLFKGASFRVVHRTGSEIVTYDDLAIMFGLKAGPARRLSPPPAIVKPAQAAPVAAPSARPSLTAIVSFRSRSKYVARVPERAIPPCAASMGCLCAGHARGNAASAPCDTRESVGGAA
ncbi:MAG TPA: hypothetical protein VG871_05140 [Vicinamibacterales bacterium]|nr:hypothetical protein [Vicinamibacterales bacterium]